MALKPGDMIGIIGGGQLGRMLAMAAAQLGFKTTILDPQQDAPAFQCANETITAAYDDLDALKELASRVQVITYEFENVPVHALNALSRTPAIHPNTDALETSQDRLVEKRFLNASGWKQLPFLQFQTSRIWSALSSTWEAAAY